MRGKARKAEPLSCSGAAVAASPLARAGGFSPSFSGSSSLPLDARRRSERESGCSGNDPPCWGPLGMFAVLCCCVHAARGPFFLLRARSRAGVFCGRSRGRRPDGKEKHLRARSPSEWFLLLDAAFHARAKAGSVSVSDAGSSYIIGSSLLFVSVRLCFAHRPSACLSVCLSALVVRVPASRARSRCEDTPGFFCFAFMLPTFLSAGVAEDGSSTHAGSFPMPGSLPMSKRENPPHVRVALSRTKYEYTRRASRKELMGTASPCR